MTQTITEGIKALGNLIFAHEYTPIAKTSKKEASTSVKTASSAGPKPATSGKADSDPWQSKDYVVRLFDFVESGHPTDAIGRHIESMRYRRGRESTLSPLGHINHEPKLYDRFKERGSEYVKREILRQLLDDTVLDDDTRSALRQQIDTFNASWKPFR